VSTSHTRRLEALERIFRAPRGELPDFLPSETFDEWWLRARSMGFTMEDIVVASHEDEEPTPLSSGQGEPLDDRRPWEKSSPPPQESPVPPSRENTPAVAVPIGTEPALMPWQKAELANWQKVRDDDAGLRPATTTWLELMKGESR
jgi:hypothetical protein